MKMIFGLLVVLCAMAGGEIRSYKMDLKITENHPAKSIEAPFESRFFSEGAELLDYTEWAGKMGIFEDEGGIAIYNRTTGRMVIRAEKDTHSLVRQRLSSKTDYSFRTEVSLHQVPGVVTERRVVSRSKLPVGAKLLDSLSFDHQWGEIVQAKKADGGLLIEAEFRMDPAFELVSADMTILADHPQRKIQWTSSFAWPAGATMVQEIGSLDGENTVIITFRQDLILADGSPRDEWILKEEGGAFLMDERLAKTDGVSPLNSPPEEVVKGVLCFKVSETFESFLRYLNEEDIFEGESQIKVTRHKGGVPELRQLGIRVCFDMKVLMSKNGIDFRSDDFIIFAKEKNAVYAKVSERSLARLEEILSVVTYDPPRMIQFDLVEVVAGPESDDDYWKAKDAKVSRKMSQVVLSGLVGRLSVGDDLAVEIEGQYDADLVEVRMSFTEQGGDFNKASFKTGATLESGKPSLIQESRVGGVQKAWVVTATVIAVEEEITKMRKETK